MSESNPQQYELTQEEVEVLKRVGIEIELVPKEDDVSRLIRLERTIKRGSGLFPEDAIWLTSLAWATLRKNYPEYMTLQYDVFIQSNEPLNETTWQDILDTYHRMAKRGLVYMYKVDQDEYPYEVVLLYANKELTEEDLSRCWDDCRKKLEDENR